MTASYGTIVWAADYKPFGEATITVSTIANNLQFPGQYFDSETGLHYNFFRDYNPLIGRYIENDPIGLKGGINLYRYALNNSLKFTDPRGLFEWVNPITYWTDLYNYARTARIWGHNQYTREENTSMRHCVVSCMVVSNYGSGVARTAGIGNEIQGLVLHDIPNLPGRLFSDQPWAFQLQDLRDKERGFRCAERNNNNSNPDTQQNCIQSCQGQ